MLGFLGAAFAVVCLGYFYLSAGIGTSGVLLATFVFVILKLLGILHYSWLWITLPLWALLPKAMVFAGERPG